MLRGLCRFMVRPTGRLADDHANAVCVDRLCRELVMDVFDLDEAVIDRCKAFARSFTDIRSPELSAKVDELYATRRFWPEPLIQLNSHYADGGSIQDFIDAGDLEPECAEVFRGLPNADQKPERASPVSREQAAAALATDCRLSEEDCATAIRNALIGFGAPENQRGLPGGTGEPLFAFKLHQFIAGAGRLYSTLRPEGQRDVTFSGQIFNPNNGEERLYAVHFCRNCGQEFHPVTLRADRGREYFEKREIDDIPVEADDEGAEWGFLMPEPDDPEFTFAAQAVRARRRPSHHVSDSQSHDKVRPPAQVAVFCAAPWPNLQPALTTPPYQVAKRHQPGVPGCVPRQPLAQVLTRVSSVECRVSVQLDSYSGAGEAPACAKTLIRMAHPARFERATSAFGGQRSIQLSYGCSRRTAGAHHRQAGRRRQWRSVFPPPPVPLLPGGGGTNAVPPLLPLLPRGEERAGVRWGILSGARYCRTVGCRERKVL